MPRLLLLVLTSGVITLAAAYACGDSINEVATALDASGFTVGESSDDRLVYIGAPVDDGILINGHHVLIYRYSRLEKVREGVEAIEAIIAAGTGLWGYDQANPEGAYHVQGRFIVYWGDHPEGERIRQALEDKIDSETNAKEES